MTSKRVGDAKRSCGKRSIFFHDADDRLAADAAGGHRYTLRRPFITAKCNKLSRMNASSDRATTHDLGGAIRSILPSLEQFVRFQGSDPARARSQWRAALDTSLPLAGVGRINHSICHVDNGRVLGLDNAHDYHHRHYMGEVTAVEFISYESSLEIFQQEWLEIVKGTRGKRS